MPKQGWRSVTLSEAVIAKIEKRAETEHRSLANMIEVIILAAIEK